ncbi:hypothetical protein BGZ58_001269 [Dissophora ornata]|nr:hypothetical protein BGZ58_001269 [Dissophora ornata]
MREVMDLFPDEAFERLNQIAFIPVMSRSYIIDNHRVIHPPSFRLRFWKPSTQPLYKLPDPILQLQVPSKTTNPHIERFRLPLFMASFDALWHYKDGKVYLGTNSNSAAGASEPLPTTWWKTLYHILRLKASPKSHLFVECYDFNLEFYDNPAIAALVAYKWNTIGFWYWVVRFFSQCCFYALVIIASIMQVYYPEPSKLVGVFVAIIAMSTIFLWFELVQATRSWIQYKKSKYNALDIVTFVLPMAASIDQLVVIFENDSKGNNRALSFSVLAVFLHLLIELRINETVCKYVTIIQEAVFQIRVFFFIFAGGILAFTITILHLLRSCPFEGCDAPTTNYSGHFLGALSATYFFMGGRWDPVSDEFDSHDWAFHLAMVMFFFFTVILMLNVLIALINVAFIKGDDSWRLVWIDSRLRCIESAENLSYHIPGFRQTYDWFPKEIYFAASPKQVREYREKYSANGKSTQDSVILEEWMRAVRNDDDYLQDDDNDDEEIEESAKSSRHEESHEVEDGETLDKGKSKFSDDSDDEVERWRFNNEEANELEEVEADDIEPGASGGRVTELGPADTYVNEQETAGTDANGQEIADKDVTATNPERNIEMSDSFSRMDTDMSTVVQLQIQLVDLKAQVEALEKTLAEQLSTQQKTLEEKLLQQLAAQQKQSQQQQLEMQQEHSKRLLEELKTLLQPSPGP